MSAWVLPPSTLRWLDEVPDQPVVMLVRHSVRGPLPPGAAGYTVPITEEGRALAVALGERLRGRLRSVRTSPLTRTAQTADALALGAGLDIPPLADTLLGDPGVFVVDARAGDTWEALGHEYVMGQLVGGPAPLPGCADPEPAARFLVHHALARARGAPGVHAFVTHDSLVAATAARVSGVALPPSEWPWYLEAAFFWEAEGEVHVAYRGPHRRRPGPLVSLAGPDVIGLARREVAATLGLGCRARFFVVGPSFDALRADAPASRLTLWAPTADDRAVIAAELRGRGGVDLAEARAPGVAVEHQPADRWRAWS